MKRRLWDHQVAALAYSRQEPHPALYMEMRLGKTMVAIRRIKMYAPIDSSQGLRVLIVAPSSAFKGWLDDLALEGEYDVAVLLGPKKKRLARLRENHRWNLLNKEGWRAIPQIAEVSWDAVVCDEAHFLKNPKAHVTKFFLRNFRDCLHRWALTGTPNPESDLELWCQIAFLDGSAFGFNSYWNFRAKCFDVPPWGYGWQPKVGAPTMIRKELGKRAHVVRRKDVNMSKHKIYETRSLTMPVKLRKTYDDAEATFILETELIEIDRTQWAIKMYQWLRQMCGGFLDSEHVWDGKVKEICSLMSGQLVGQSVVIWFCYNQEIPVVADALRKINVGCRSVTGATPEKKRRALYSDFQAGKFPVLLLQEAVAQTGLDLSQADTAIYYSNPTGFTAKVQTEDRILHMAKTQPLLYLDLIVEDSVDEDIYDALRDKRVRSRMTMTAARRYCLGRKANNAKAKICA